MKPTSLPRTAQRLLEAAQEEAVLHPDFFSAKGPGRGDHSTNAYICALQARALKSFDGNFSEAPLVKGTGVRVDYWFPKESTIVEIALGLKNPLSEFERDVLKAVISRGAGMPVKALVLIGKPGAIDRLKGPWFMRVREWAEGQGVTVYVRELQPETPTSVQKI